jgi:guanosine-3',5'-bis(diphosphate) 3'-pyrophosphohydrolase
MEQATNLIKNYDISSATYVYVIALLHDVVEDTDTTPEEIEKEFGKYISNCVKILTHNKGIETYPEYIDRIMSSNFTDAKLVKHADMRDHLAQKETLTPRLKEKYYEVIDRFI